MNAILPTSRVPPEFLGKARGFGNRILDADNQFMTMRDELLARFGARLRRKPTLRLDDCLDGLSRWRALGLFGQPPESWAKLEYAKRRVVFSDYRLTTSTGHREEWGEGVSEPGVDLMLVELIFEPREGYAHQDITGVFNVSLHALGRFYQRAFRSSDEVLAAAIWAALGEIKGLPPDENGDFALPVPVIGGHWFGQRTNTAYVHENAAFDKALYEQAKEFVSVLNIRTYHTEL
jgi:hypothetical protein